MRSITINRVYNVISAMNKIDLNELKELLTNSLIESIQKVYLNDRDLLDNKVSERCVCARLAFYLELSIRHNKIFDGYYVDVEYDRMQDRLAKRIGLGRKKHICDLLIHSRGQQIPDNLLAVEMKVHNNYTKAPDDRVRLKDLVQHRNKKNKDSVCETIYGVFLRLRCDKYCYQTFDIEQNGGNPSRIIDGDMDFLY